MRKKTLYITLALLIFSLTIGLGWARLNDHWQTQKREQLSLKQRIDLSWEIADYKLTKTIDYLRQNSLAGRNYPEYTEKGKWTKARAKSWAAGYFPGLLWKMSLHTKKDYWRENARKWGQPLRDFMEKATDVTTNNLLVFAPWFEQSEGAEKTEQLDSILAGARTLSKRFHLAIGTLGIARKAKTDNQVHWQSFIDHIINVEQLLWASAHNPNPLEAKNWRDQAIRHIKTLGATFGKNRHPGNSGTWQRGYFDDRVDSPTYKKFLFNEGKQGWRNDSTWSRGQAWVIYGSSTTYQYTQDPQVLKVAKESINYFLSQLPKDGIVPWDFDYALQHPETEKDSSASAIALAGIIRLLQTLPRTDPDWLRYKQGVDTILIALTSRNYLPDKESPQMSLLNHGCYHHPQSLTPSQIYDNGLIWGDYFFIAALLEYEKL